MQGRISFLGGTEEVGANSSYLYLDGTGIIIDSGLHPKKRDKDAFPHFGIIEDEPVDFLLLTHSHTDHIGGIPYALKFHPQLKILASHATCDLLYIMIRDTAKLLKSEVREEFADETLSLYNQETLKKIGLLAHGINYDQKIDLSGKVGLSEVHGSFHPAGHILGSSSLLIESGGRTIMHTGDINFADQNIIRGARPPGHHIDVLIAESTNFSGGCPEDYYSEHRRLAAFVNDVTGRGGSVLVPVFSLGKTQEVLKIFYDLMRKGSIPTLPIYSGGLGRKISRVYDRYCYTEPMVRPGFEVSDIPQQIIKREELFTAKYFKEPSIVIASSGMLNKGTISFRLAEKWFMEKDFGIAMVGYQDEDSNGFSLLNSEKGKPFKWAGRKAIRSCEVDKFRFTSHALPEDMLEYIERVKPSILFIVHGDIDSCEAMAAEVTGRMPQTRVIIPEAKRQYELF